MRSVSRRQKDKDPQAVCSVSSFTPRPMLRVGGGKDKGPRFLSFVDSMLGFRHLLKQEDLDKAASMCQGLKGHLRSRFLVLSDDRQPPPAPTKKRPHPDQTEMTGPSPNMKRFQVSNPGNFVGTSSSIGSTGFPPSGPQLTSSSATIFSPSSFPPLPAIVREPPLIQEDLSHAVQVPQNRASRRQTLRGVPGLQKVVPTGAGQKNAGSKGPRESKGQREIGLTEELDPDYQDNGSESDSSFVDAAQ